MSDDPIDDQLDLPNMTTGPAPSASDTRDATIEQLERTVAEQRQHSATLRKSIEELRFKADVLEQGYSKQLEDARLRAEAAEQEVADHQVRMTALDSAHQDAMQSLAEAQTELERLTTERDQSRKLRTWSDGPPSEAMAQDSPESQDQEGQTIDELMDDVKWSRDRQPDGNKKVDLEAEQGADEEPPLEDMIAPDWAFARKNDDNDES